MYLLDTDTLSALHRENANVIARLARTSEVVATTIITRVEILRGRLDYVRKAATGDEVLRAQHWLNRSEELLALIQIVPFDAAAARLFDGLQTIPRLRKIGSPDLLIASIALAHAATLVTRNLRHFQLIPRLRFENWMD